MPTLGTQMPFVQLESFRTDDITRVVPLAERWQAETTGRNTLIAYHVFADRNDPRRYVVINEFESYESAMANSDLPETATLAAELSALVEDLTYTDLVELALPGEAVR